MSSLIDRELDLKRLAKIAVAPLFREFPDAREQAALEAKFEKLLGKVHDAALEKAAAWHDQEGERHRKIAARCRRDGLNKEGLFRAAKWASHARNAAAIRALKALTTEKEG